MPAHHPFAPITRPVIRHLPDKFASIGHVGPVDAASVAAEHGVSRDLGQTWQTLGEAVDVWQGPFFGADEKTMVAAGPQGLYKTTTAGTTWTKISGLRPNTSQNFSFSTNRFGTYAWDPVYDGIYATAMSHPAFKRELSTDKE